MSRTLVASITELCRLDHHDDPAAIATWTANKTEAGIAAMLAAPANRMFVAERDGEIAAVGCIRLPDEIGLNYVSPGHRFAGVSKALLATMETELQTRGVAVARLSSTGTAHGFYESAGWRDVGSGECDAFGMICHPMRKPL